jgi:hypothetical protein
MNDNPKSMTTLGLDIGGANTKVATSREDAEIFYLPLWKDLKGLRTLLRRVSREADGVFVVMTGELSDCFRDKRDGVLSIGGAVNAVFRNAEFFSVRGRFEKYEGVKKHPRDFAASNWVASANFLARDHKNAIFVDAGSTTMDVIPIKNGKHRAHLTDFERLRSSELLFSGMLRTNVAAVLKEKIVSSEFFAITADAYLVLGDITAREYTCDTPNYYAKCGGKNRRDAMRRLARVFCCDLEEFRVENAIKVAEEVKEAQLVGLTNAINRIKKKHNLDTILACGLGEFLVEEAAERLKMKCERISEKYGKKVSIAFPAYAVAKLGARALNPTK